MSSEGLLYWSGVPRSSCNDSEEKAQTGQTKGALQLLVFFVGITGNLFALVKLTKRRTSSYTMMLRCLLVNNLILLTVCAPLILIKHFLPDDLFKKYGRNRIYCAAWVIIDFFGINSGCIAAIMSIDNYMAMNHPFYHREHNKPIIKVYAILSLGLIAAVTNFLPLIGVGSYFDEQRGQCLRTRDGNSFAHNLVNAIFGTLICVVIVTCNTFVIKVLILKSWRKSSDISSNTSQSILKLASTDEIKFAKIMAFLSLSFVFNWLPETISSIIALKQCSLPDDYWFYTLADVLVLLHFTLDPYVYVFCGGERSCFANIKDCWTHCLRRS